MSKIPNVNCVYYGSYTDAKAGADVLFINTKMSIDEINKIMDNYCMKKNEKSIKLICLLGDKDNKDLIKTYPNVYRVWAIDDTTTYDNGFTTEYDILCRYINNHFKSMEYNYTFSMINGEIEYVLIF